MFRVAQHLPLVVVAPVPWFPLQRWLRCLRPGFRPDVPYYEAQQGIEVYHPRFLSIPGLLKFTDSFFEALGSLPTLLRLRRKFRFELIDSHFGYPDGVAAWLLAKWLGQPFTITLRGTQPFTATLRGAYILRPWICQWLTKRALRTANRVFSVSESLRQMAIHTIGIDPEQIQVIANGVDYGKFHREDRIECRYLLGIPQDALVMISVGGLFERKGYHHVIALMPKLLDRFPNLHYVIAGGPGPEGNWEERLKILAKNIGLNDRVHFLGPVSPERLRFVYSSGDLFVLATQMEGWANVFLEACACGLPVVTTDVGGNREVVGKPELGIIVPYGDWGTLREAIMTALGRSSWDREAIIAHGRENSWETRIPALVQEFCRIHTSLR